MPVTSAGDLVIDSMMVESPDDLDNMGVWWTCFVDGDKTVVADLNADQRRELIRWLLRYTDMDV